ncbi:hypothetical protein DRE_06265 [Drechslerella stenobrocha 248]|uniref:AB hydrolase-1 domain-containing protein n=1 Tax=Drechslerella stenobrocha 248 TaxID=1043628 RepID=W7HMB6_9PEZI|nr:hypothetical protein DRE_06265 [Drechslerella stenobrocha 248]
MHIRALHRPIARLGTLQPGAYRYCYRGFHATGAATAPTVDMAYNLHRPPTGGDDKREPIIFMHGLFGSKANNRGISKAFAKELNRCVYALDLRNHGDSPHAQSHTYPAMAEDVEQFIRDHALENPTLIGHSMYTAPTLTGKKERKEQPANQFVHSHTHRGAKVAMSVALRSPSLLQDIVVVDNAPVSAQLGRQFGLYAQAMARIEATPIVNAKEADDILAAYEPVVEIRQFLLTNLLKPTPENDRFRWRVPVRVLSEALDAIADFPFTPGAGPGFTKPALFVRGTKSKYVADETIPLIGEFFPRFQLRDVEAGHWVTSENPEGFKKVCLEFFRREKDE